MTTAAQLMNRVKDLDDRTVCEMYSRLWQRAVDNNPLKEWQLKMNPTKDDLREVLSVLPPKDCRDIEDQYF